MSIVHVVYLVEFVQIVVQLLGPFRGILFLSAAGEVAFDKTSVNRVIVRSPKLIAISCASVTRRNSLRLLPKTLEDAFDRRDTTYDGEAVVLGDFLLVVPPSIVKPRYGFFIKGEAIIERV